MFLLEDNEARQAVARGDNLRELLTRPIDTEEINAEIERLQAEKRQLDEQIEHIDDRERDLVDLEQRKTRLETEIDGQILISRRNAKSKHKSKSN